MPTRSKVYIGHSIKVIYAHLLVLDINDMGTALVSYKKVILNRMAAYSREAEADAPGKPEPTDLEPAGIGDQSGVSSLAN